MAETEWNEAVTSEFEFALRFVSNIIERLDDLFTKGASEGGCSIRMVHKSSPAWAECEEEGQWDEPGNISYKIKDAFYVHCLDQEETPEEMRDPDATYIEIYFEDMIVSGHVHPEEDPIARLITSKGGEA